MDPPSYNESIPLKMRINHIIEKATEEENKQKWVHCDIAGPAFVEEVWGCNPEGASGAGVRFTVEFFKNFL
jgi:leucyl aminopeptidase